MRRPYPKSVWTPAWAAQQPLAYHDGEPLRIGTRTQLLAHSALVEDRRGVVRKVMRPERYPAPVLVAEHPWENRRTFYPQVLADEQRGSGRLRMWYGTLPAVPLAAVRAEPGDAPAARYERKGVFCATLDCISRPSEVLLIGEGRLTSSGGVYCPLHIEAWKIRIDSKDYPNWGAATRHNDGMNIIFADGHAKWSRTQEVLFGPNRAKLWLHEN